MRITIGRNKYGNVKKEYNGFVYDSTKEAAFARDLDFRLMGKDIKSWQKQIRYTFVHEGKRICSYVLDFLIENNDGTFEYVDVKSEATRKLAVYRLKKRLMKVFFDIDIAEY